ncbi:efflux transporter outer membrane subunit (plasmid) [Skermanella mucosa]|uniref:efflux transporter outer membrane subunit n=1 Tax=Skermanella mucosa TaxID=1789672 RepID=UPI00192AE825|nr:efflux transporter outer membrane subunit [Skermanella mucosa]UEM24703.1 efflux transporter outer membrane subunit [Skermanella mucosa]
MRAILNGSLFWLCAAGALGTAGCSLAPDAVVPVTVAALPAEFEQADVAAAYRPLGWWETFDDPALDALVRQAVDRNLDLAQAVARVEQARAQARIAGAPLSPEVGASVGASRRDQPASGFGSGEFDGGGLGSDGEVPASVTGGPEERTRSERFSASLDLSYELDFWGRVRNAENAAEARLGATVGDLQTVVLSVIAETIRAYFDILATRRRLDLVRPDVDLLRERAALTERRYLRGLVDSFEFYAIQGELRGAQAEIPRLESRLYAARARLATLLGRYPGELGDVVGARSDRAPLSPPDPIPAGLPSALLIQRPDVRAAWLRLEAQRYEVGAARAALFPRFTISAGAGLRAGTAGGLFDLSNWFTSLTAGLTAPIFQGGRLRGEVDAAEAALAEAAGNYASSVLTAVREVETALKDHETTAERYRLLARELETARSRADLQLRRYTQGIGDYLGFLDSRRNVVAAREAVLQAERDLVEARLAVHRSLGGVWIEEDLSDRIKALVAAATGESRTERDRDA